MRISLSISFSSRGRPTDAKETPIRRSRPLQRRGTQRRPVPLTDRSPFSARLDRFLDSGPRAAFAYLLLTPAMTWPLALNWRGALPAGAGAQRARHLHRVRGVEHHRAAGVAHDREGPHVRDQVVVAERRAPLAHHDALVARRLGFGDHLAHVPRGQELAFLDVHRPALAADVLNEVGLPAQERGGLQHRRHRRHFIEGRVLVDVGEHRHADFPAHPLQDAQTLRHARAAVALVGRAVGLVEGALVDERHARRGGDLAQGLGGFERQLLGLDDARAGDQKHRPAQADLEALEPHPPRPRRPAARRAGWRRR